MMSLPVAKILSQRSCRLLRGRRQRNPGPLALFMMLRGRGPPAELGVGEGVLGRRKVEGEVVPPSGIWTKNHVWGLLELAGHVWLRWSKNRTGENRTGEPRPSTRGPFRGHLRGMFRGESLKGRKQGNQPSWVLSWGSRGRTCGATRGHTRGAIRGPTRGSRFAFACSVRRPSECPKECFLSAFWRFLSPESTKKHPKNTPWNTRSQVPKIAQKTLRGHFPVRAPWHSCKWRLESPSITQRSEGSNF